MLGEDPTYGTSGSLGSPGKSVVIVLVKQAQSVAWVYVIMLIIVICLLMEKKYLSLKPTIKMLTFQRNFVCEKFLMDLVLLNLDKYL